MNIKTSIDNLMDALVKSVQGIRAAAIVDKEGLIIASKFTVEGHEDETIGSITAMLDNFMSRVKKDFGSANNFVTILAVDQNKFLFANIGTDAILTILTELEVNENAMKVYAAHFAKKMGIALRGDEVDHEIPFIVQALANVRTGQLKGNYITKVILIGDPLIGKTSLIRRFVDNTFISAHVSSIGIDLSKKRINLNDQCTFEFVIWDIGGQIQHMTPNWVRFYNGADFAFVVCDITQRESFDHIENWISHLKHAVTKPIPLVIIANKCDKALEEHKITQEEMQVKAESLGYHWGFTSAKTGANVEEAFQYCALKYLESL